MAQCGICKQDFPLENLFVPPCECDLCICTPCIPKHMYKDFCVCHDERCQQKECQGYKLGVDCPECDKPWDPEELPFLWRFALLVKQETRIDDDWKFLAKIYLVPILIIVCFRMAFTGELDLYSKSFGIGTILVLLLFPRFRFVSPLVAQLSWIILGHFVLMHIVWNDDLVTIKFTLAAFAFSLVVLLLYLKKFGLEPQGGKCERCFVRFRNCQSGKIKLYNRNITTIGDEFQWAEIGQIWIWGLNTKCRIFGCDRCPKSKEHRIHGIRFCGYNVRDAFPSKCKGCNAQPFLKRYFQWE